MEPEILRILLIEDDPVLAGLMRDLLSESMWTRFELEHADRLSRGLELLEHGNHDLVLLDLSLPDSNGFDTFSEVRRRVPHVALIVLSGIDDEELATKTVQAGAQDYLIKGQVDGRALLRAMRYALERNRMEQALTRERQLLWTLIDNLPDYIYVKDAQSRFVVNNHAHVRILGVASPDAAVGKNDFDFFPQELAAQYFADEKVLIESGKPLVNREEPVIDHLGRQRWLLTSKSPLTNPAGKVIGLVGISRDITELKQAEQKLRAQNAEIQRDLQIAREFQEALMPREYPQVPTEPTTDPVRLNFHHVYQPALSVGGDFFDVVQLSDHRVGVFISDVMGHGARAALVTAILRTLWQDLAEYADDPGQFLTLMNKHFYEIIRRANDSIFASAFYLVLDTQTGQAQYSDAGHPSPLLADRKSGKTSMLMPVENSKPALGLMQETAYETFTSTIQADQLFLLFTDGIVETPNEENEEFGYDRLRGLIEQNLDRPLNELTQIIVQAINSYIGASALPDDICLLGVDVSAASKIPH